MAADVRTILLVDDDPDVRSIVAAILDAEGYHTVEAASGLEALDYLKKSPTVSLILLDLMMPEMDGWQFRSEQAKDPGAARIPVVIISAVAKAEEEKAKSLGAAAFLHKPFDLSDLLTTVRENVN